MERGVPVRLQLRLTTECAAWVWPLTLKSEVSIILAERTALHLGFEICIHVEMPNILNHVLDKILKCL